MRGYKKIADVEVFKTEEDAEIRQNESGIGTSMIVIGDILYDKAWDDIEEDEE